MRRRRGSFQCRLAAGRILLDAAEVAPLDGQADVTRSRPGDTRLVTIFGVRRAADVAVEADAVKGLVDTIVGDQLVEPGADDAGAERAHRAQLSTVADVEVDARSEERRVGKECVRACRAG